MREREAAKIVDELMKSNPDLAKVNIKANPLPAFAAAVQAKKKRNDEEKRLLNRIFKVAELNGWIGHHTRAAWSAKGYRTPIKGTKGFPDAVFVRTNELGHMSDILFVETKSENGKLTIEQTLWKEILEMSLCEYWLVRPSTENKMIERLCGR